MSQTPDQPEMNAADTPTLTTGAEEVESVRPVTARQRFIRRFKAQRLVMFMLGILIAAIGVAIFAPWLAPYDPSAIDPVNRNAGPSAAHWLGQDELGRDMLSRLIFGTQISLAAAFQAVLLALVIGVPIGLVSGYAGGVVDLLMMRFNDAIMSFPALILAIAIVGLLGPSLRNAMIAIGIVFSPRLARVVRGATLAVREETYVEAARSLGCGPFFIVRKHILPNILSPLIVQSTLSLALAILQEASLSFLGLGVQPPIASWGSILGRSFAYLNQNALNVITPGICIMLVVLSLNVVGDGLRDAFGRERRKG